MWTFEILNKTKIDENTIELEVKFSNGVKTFQRNFYPAKGTSTRTWLENEIKREVTEFENRQTFNAGIKKGIFTLTPLPTPTPEPEPTPPTQDELDKAEFVAKFHEYTRKKKLVDAGVLQASVLTPIVDRMKVLYKEEWISTLLI